jgi:hypothetical protein
LKLTSAQPEVHWREHALGGFLLAQASFSVLLANGCDSLIFTGASGSLRGKAERGPNGMLNIAEIAEAN